MSAGTNLLVGSITDAAAAYAAQVYIKMDAIDQRRAVAGADGGTTNTRDAARTRTSARQRI